MSDAIRKAAEIVGWRFVEDDGYGQKLYVSECGEFCIGEDRGSEAERDVLALQLWRKWCDHHENDEFNQMNDVPPAVECSVTKLLRTDSLKAIELMVNDMEVG